MKKVLDVCSYIRKTLALKAKGWLEWLRMNREQRIEKSRDAWKEKARIRADEIRENRKARIIERAKNKELKDEVRRLKVELKKKQKNAQLQ